MTVVNRIWEEVRGASADIRAYLGSAEFEEGLDELAARLRVDFSTLDSARRGDPRGVRGSDPGRGEARSFLLRHRRLRIRAKAVLLLERSSAKVIKAAGVGSTIGMVTRNPQVILVASVIGGGIQALSIALDAYDCLASTAIPESSSVPGSF